MPRRYLQKLVAHITSDIKLITRYKKRYHPRQGSSMTLQEGDIFRLTLLAYWPNRARSSIPIVRGRI